MAFVERSSQTQPQPDIKSYLQHALSLTTEILRMSYLEMMNWLTQ